MAVRGIRIPLLVPAVFVLGGLVADGAGAQMCKWVDVDGSVHYAEKCPPGVDGSQVQLQAPPTAEEIQAAEQRAAAASRRLRTQQPAAARPGKSLSLHELGPLPDNASSRYLTTVSTGILTSTRDLNAQFTLTLRANPALPAGAWVEVRFPDPDSPGSTHAQGETVERSGAEITFTAPAAKDFRCMNYEVEALVFEDATGQTLLGTHRQTIQSRLDMSGVRNAADLVMGMAGRFCPDDLSGRSVAELEGLCEEAREQRLQPLRDAELERCIEQQGRDPEYCERYFSTYGDSEVRGNRVIPRMFDDLPECVAARQARAEQQR